MNKAWRNWTRLGLFERVWLLWWPPAAAATAAAFFGWYRLPLIVFLQIWLWLGLLALLKPAIAFWLRTPTQLRRGLVGIGFIWLLHLVQVFVPETGFDAVWYHLPVLQTVLDAGRLTYLPELYQTLNPLWSDLLFGVGFVGFRDTGAKIIAFAFSLSLVLAVYGMARQWLSKTSTLWLVALVSVFQVVAWQSSSFYVDVAKAFWEIMWLWGITRALKHKLPVRHLMLANLAFGAALATKLFSLLLLPLGLVATILVSRKRRMNFRTTLIGLALLILPALPYYFFSWQQTGHPFYVMSLVGADLASLTSSASSLQYVAKRTVQLPLSVPAWLIARDYVFPWLIFLLPFAFVGWRWIYAKQRAVLFGLTVFTICQWLVWWYLPPWSTRYALSGFIVMALLIIWGWQQNAQAPRWTKYILLAGILLQLIPRLMVTARSLPYLSGQQTKIQYLQQFLDGSIDAKLISWHSGVWRDSLASPSAPLSLPRVSPP